MGNYNALITTITRCLEKEINLEERRDLLSRLSNAYAQIGLYDKALATKDSLIATIDTLYNIQGKNNLRIAAYNLNFFVVKEKLKISV